ncbi:MAG: ArsR/SmtB family transcription factor [Mycobacterium leprae]
MTLNTIDRIALALSDPIRLQVLDLIAAGRMAECCSPSSADAPAGVCACDIQPQLSIAPTKLAYHLKILREAGLITEMKRGRWVYYNLDLSTLTDFVGALQSRFAPGDRPSCGGCC